jgi:pre-mRNA-splicing factor ATP-dependent RNA helicase DHX38/PRP16
MDKLISEVAYRVSLELKHDQQSLPLGKEFVNKAVMYKNVDEFSNSLSKFGKCSSTFYKEIHQYIYNELKGSDSVQFSSNIEKFQDSTPTSGGLMIPTTSGGLMIPNEHSIKKPQKSLLGLDKFAEEKKRKREEQEDEEKREKKYRQPRISTPSHPGGVNEEALEKIKQKEKYNKYKGETYDSRKYDKEERRRDYDDRRNRDYEDDRRRRDYDDDDRRRRRDDDDDRRRDRKDYDSKKYKPEFSPKRSEWDRTPKRNEPNTPNSTPKTWEAPSPIRKDSKYVDSTPLNETPTYKKKKKGFEGDEADDVDYQWYGDGEEDGNVIDMTSNPFENYGDSEKFDKREKEYKKKQRVSAKYTEMLKENQEWEENRMMQSGIAILREVRTEFEEDENKVQIIVHDVNPPFLDGKIEFTKQVETITPVKDLNSDLSLAAKKGSSLLTEIRSQRERMKAVKQNMKLSGTNFGNLIGQIEKDSVTGVTKIVRGDDIKKESNTGEDLDLKGDSKFSQLLPTEKSVGFTNFSKQTMSDQKSQLPIFQCKKDLLDLIQDNSVIIVVGETGSGKTTQMCQFLHEAGYTTYGKIGITQPRRVAAMSVAKRVSEEMNCELGSTVGYAIRFEDCTSEETLIKFMTDGVLLRESIHGADLDQYSCIILDEAHERSLHTDVLFGILKNIVAKRRDLKLIVTSATMDSKKFSDFFGSVPIFMIPGRTFHVDIMYAKSPVSDYVEAAVKQAMTIHLGTPTDEGDILIFMTGQEDIEVTCYILADKLSARKDAPALEILPIYSMLPTELQAKIFRPSVKGVRKCIVATNIAETSLTVDGITFVIDCAFCKMKVYNPRVGMDALQVYPESQAGAKQRSGRAGRTGPGKCYRLFTEKQFKNEMLSNTVPEIQRTNLSNVVLLLKSLGIKDLLEFNFMDSPPQENMKKSMYQLWLLGALNSKGDLTKLGEKMIEFPLDPPLSKIILISDELGCSNEAITIVSCLSVPTIFYRPKDREDESDSVREKFFVPESDHLTLLNVYQQWRSHNYSAEWCSDHFLHFKSMKKIREVREQIIDIMKKLKLRLTTVGQDWDVVRKAICAGFYHHCSKLKGIGEYVNLLGGMTAHLHPSSALFGMGSTPEYVIYHELVLTTKEYMRTVTSIDGSWLEELAPVFFSVKKGHTTRSERLRENKKQLEKVGEEIQNEKKQKEEEETSKKTPQRMVTPGRKEPKTPRRMTGL